MGRAAMAVVGAELARTGRHKAPARAWPPRHHYAPSTLKSQGAVMTGWLERIPPTNGTRTLCVVLKTLFLRPESIDVRDRSWLESRS